MDSLFYWTGVVVWVSVAIAAGVAIYRAVFGARAEAGNEWPPRQTMDQVLAQMTSFDQLPPRSPWEPELSAMLNVGRHESDVLRMLGKPVRYRYADGSLVVPDKSGYGVEKVDFMATHWVVIEETGGHAGKTSRWANEGRAAEMNDHDKANTTQQQASL